MGATRAHAFVRDGTDAWHRHDADAVLAHCADEATSTFPAAARIVAGSDGVIRGKDASGAHWYDGSRRISDLRFELVEAISEAG